jgi:hypothetical protein
MGKKRKKRMLSLFRSFSALAIAAALAPFIFFAVLLMMVFGLASVTFGPLILAFVAWMMLSRWSRRERKERGDTLFEARVVREDAPPPFPLESYTPTTHFDLLLSAKHDIGRIRGAMGNLDDAGLARQFIALANQAETVLALVMKEPAKLGLARRFFSSYLPRAAELAVNAHRAVKPDGTASDSRRKKLLDILYRLEVAMKAEEAAFDAPELARLDADMKLLGNDLKDIRMDDFRRAPEPVLERVDAIIKSARKK